MPHIYALQGSGGCGKSDTLTRLFQNLSAKYPSAKLQHLHNRRTADVAVIMSGVNGLIVGIESQGDPGSWLKDSLADFSKYNCDIIFCACRTRGMTVDWVNALSSKYSINFVPQTYDSTNYKTTNAATALSLMKQAGI